MEGASGLLGGTAFRSGGNSMVIRALRGRGMTAVGGKEDIKSPKNEIRKTKNAKLLNQNGRNPQKIEGEKGKNRTRRA